MSFSIPFIRTYTTNNSSLPYIQRPIYLNNYTKFYYNAPCSSYTDAELNLSNNCVNSLWSTAGCLTNPSVVYNLNNFNIPGTAEYNFTKSSLSTNMSNYSQQNTFNPINTPLCYSTNFMNWPFIAASSSINAPFSRWQSITTPPTCIQMGTGQICYGEETTTYTPVYEGEVQFSNRYNTFAMNLRKNFTTVTYLNITLPSGFTMDSNSFYTFPNNLLRLAQPPPYNTPYGFTYKIRGQSQSTNTNPPSLTFTFVAVGT
jgi:hypothetical protein